MTIADEAARIVTQAAPMPFFDTLPGEVAQLLDIPVDEKLEAFDQASQFLNSARGKATREGLRVALESSGYLPRSARHEIEALAGFLSRRHLESLVDNPSVLPGGRRLLDGGFVTIGPGVAVTGMPAGPLLVVGSGNSFVPSVVASVIGLLASCPVALRGAGINQPILESLFAALKTCGSRLLASLLDHLHLFFLDHADPAQGEVLRRVLREGPFAAGSFWGGRQALDALVKGFGENPRHPMAIPMEPLTGVAVATERYLRRTAASVDEAAQDLADAVTEMGQQMCSSPTEAYLVGSMSIATTLARRLGQELDRIPELRRRRISDRNAMLIDRIREGAADLDRVVVAPRDGDAAWTVIVSDGQSVFLDERGPSPLPIHERTAFLEIVVIPTLEAAADRIARLPSAPCHAGVKQVQTVIRLTHLDDAQRLIQLLRRQGCGIYRSVPPDYVALRHPLEPMDGHHLLGLLTRQLVVI